MKKLNLYFNNPQVDFFIKTFLMLTVVPFFVLWLSLQVLYIFGKESWEAGLGGGPLAFLIVGFYFSIVIYFGSFFLVTLGILLLNKKFMSGDKIPLKTKIMLFLLSVLFYLFTLFALSFFRALF